MKNSNVRIMFPLFRYCFGTAILAIVASFLLSPAPVFAQESENTGNEYSNRSIEKEPLRVVVADSIEQKAEFTLRVIGSTEANRQYLVRAETNGKVEETNFEMGDRVSAHQLLCRLELGARDARIRQAMAQLEVAETEFQSAKSLSNSGYVSKIREISARAQVDAANTALKEAKLDAERIFINAPFDGVVAEKAVEVGDVLGFGGICAKLLDDEKIKVVGQVSEKEIQKVHIGQKAEVRVVTGEVREGVVTFVSNISDLKTRTFKVEVTIDNQDHSVRVGISAEIFLLLDPVQAHLLPQSVLTLSDEGIIGVKVLDDENRARFVPVQILRDDRRGVWVTGLDKKLTIIHIGQEYVLPGDEITPVYDQQ